MNGRLLAVAFVFLTASAHADRVYYLFDDFDLDEVFNVWVLVEGDSAGLATYNVALTGLDDSPLDPSTFVWTENVLSNFDEDFQLRGFTLGELSGAVGTNGYSAANSQFNQNAIYGVGQRQIDVPDNDVIPFDLPITLGVPALLGTLSLPGAIALSSTELLEVLTPNAALFVEEGDSSRAELATEIVLGIQGLLFPNLFEPPQPKLPSPASVLIDFNEALSVSGSDPYVEDGVTMTVTPHPTDGNVGAYTIGNSGIDDTPSLRIDGSGANNAVTFTAGGAPFSLHSIDFGPDRLAFDENVDILTEYYLGVIRTSDGVERLTSAGTRQMFSGPDFTDITSFTIYNWPGVAEVNFDNILITIVPEPAAGALAGLAAIGVAMRRRRC